MNEIDPMRAASNGLRIVDAHKASVSERGSQDEVRALLAGIGNKSLIVSPAPEVESATESQDEISGD